MTLRYLILSLSRDGQLFWRASYIPFPVSLHQIFNGTNSFSCILGLFGREHEVLKHESRIRMLTPDPMDHNSPRNELATVSYHWQYLTYYATIRGFSIVPNLLTLIRPLCLPVVLPWVLCLLSGWLHRIWSFWLSATDVAVWKTGYDLCSVHTGMRYNSRNTQFIAIIACDRQHCCQMVEWTWSGSVWRWTWEKWKGSQVMYQY
jgi:hypothetical protein